MIPTLKAVPFSAGFANVANFLMVSAFLTEILTVGFIRHPHG